MASFRTILALAVHQDWDIDAFNFNSAYLNGELSNDEEIYMKEPLGYKTPREDSVKHLQKAIYGLKQAGRKWYDALTCVLTDIGFCVSSADPRVFVAHKGSMSSSSQPMWMTVSSLAAPHSLSKSSRRSFTTATH